MSLFGILCDAVLSLFIPETCALCGRLPGEVDWTQRGGRVSGLRDMDRPHLCRSCFHSLAGQTRLRRLDSLLVVGATAVEVDLVRVLGEWKYHGLRGLAWPLADLLRPSLSVALETGGEVDALVPVPLHASRRRWRGFNQAELLAHLVAGPLGMPCTANVICRRRNTAQQARISSDGAGRAANVSGAFRALPAPEKEGYRIGLVDDVVTSGATVLAAARALARAGWRVRWALSIGLVDGVETQ